MADSEGLSAEMKSMLLSGLCGDAQRISELASRMQQNIPRTYGESYSILEQLAYITEEQRLKLKMLGAPRIYN